MTVHPAHGNRWRRARLAVTADLFAAGVVLAAAAHVLGRHYAASPAYPFKALALYAAVAAVLAVAAPRPSTGDAFGAANRVTLWRVAVACLFAGLIGEAGAVAAARAGLIAGTALFFCLDGLDGWLARRAGAASAFGRHFDHETDALFVLVLALLVYDAGRAGPWVVLSGALHYAYLAARLLWPRLRAELPASRRGQVIGFAAAAGLAACLTVLEGWAASLIAAVVLAALVVSFAIDLARLARRGG